MDRVLPMKAQQALDELLARNDPSIRGVILSGSAARGMATGHSDVDVFVVRETEADIQHMQTTRSAAIDEVPDSLQALEDVSSYGTQGWWGRWAYAYAQILSDDTDGRITAAVCRLATVSDSEQQAILIDHDRLDGWLNFAYRSLKSDRDGRPFEARLDATESLPYLLDVIFTVAGRVRPYNKYLAWELREHPLRVPEWSAENLLPEIEAMLAGHPAAIRRAFAVVNREVRAWDEAHNTTTCGDTVDSWTPNLCCSRTWRTRSFESARS